MKLILKIFLLIAICFGNYTAIAQKNKQKESSNENSLLWEISGKGLTKPSYLFGTIHMICKEDFFWDKNFEEAFQKTQQLCLEIDLTDQMALMSAAMMMMDQNGTELSSYFTTAEQEKLNQYLQEKASITLDKINQFKPMFLISILASESQSCTSNETESYEVFLMENAKKREIKVLGIESVNTQINALSSIPDSSIVQYVKTLLNTSKDSKEKTTLEKQMQELITYYKSQKIQALYDLTINNKTDMNMNMNILLNDRNEDWIPKMTEMMQQASTYFAFGAAHLAGDKGVINLLKKAGYTVIPVVPKK